MKRFYSSVCVALITGCAASFAHAAVSIVDDFGTYDLNTSINKQGSPYGANWESNGNSTTIVDPGWSRVVEENGDKALRVINRGQNNNLNVANTIMQIPNPIEDQGTIYFRWKQSSEAYVIADDDGQGGLIFPTPDGSVTVASTDPVWADFIFSTNDLNFGFDPDGDGNTDTGTPGNGISNYGDQAALTRLSGDDAGTGIFFRARDGAFYRNQTLAETGSVLGTPGVGMVFDQWYEMWIQEDFTNQQARYYLAPDGGTPTIAMNPGPDLTPGTADDSEWWAHRNTTYFNTAASVIKMLTPQAGQFDAGEAREVRLYFDTFGVDPTAWSTNSLSDVDTAPAGFAGDFDMDGDVDGNDFLVWQRDPNVGSLSDWQSDYGSGIPLSATLGAVPEPSSLILLGIAGSLGFTFRRKR